MSILGLINYFNVNTIHILVENLFCLVLLRRNISMSSLPLSPAEHSQAWTAFISSVCRIWHSICNTWNRIPVNWWQNCRKQHQMLHKFTFYSTKSEWVTCHSLHVWFWCYMLQSSEVFVPTLSRTSLTTWHGPGRWGYDSSGCLRILSFRSFWNTWGLGFLWRQLVSTKADGFCQLLEFVPPLLRNWN